MSNTPNAAVRNQLRKSLMQVASLLLLTLLSVALLALFSVWSLQRAHQRNDQEVAQLVSALDASRQAQVQFKRQVQEWKNILLRGDYPVARSRYFNAFANAEGEVQAALAKVDEALGTVRNPRHHTQLADLRREHLLLGEQYRAALIEASGGRWAPFESDLAVRGIDRPLDRNIDQLAASLVQEMHDRSKSLDAAFQRRFEALRSALWIAMVASLLLVGVLLWRVLAQQRTVSA